MAGNATAHLAGDGARAAALAGPAQELLEGAQVGATALSCSSSVSAATLSAVVPTRRTSCSHRMSAPFRRPAGARPPPCSDARYRRDKKGLRGSPNLMRNPYVFKKFLYQVASEAPAGFGSLMLTAHGNCFHRHPRLREPSALCQLWLKRLCGCSPKACSKAAASASMAASAAALFSSICSRVSCGAAPSSFRGASAASASYHSAGSSGPNSDLPAFSPDQAAQHDSV